MTTYKLFNDNTLSVLPQQADGSVFANITDPPYGIDFQSGQRTATAKFAKIANDRTPFIDWLPECYRVTKEGGCLVCFCRWDVEEVFREAITAAGFVVKSQIIWDKMIHGMGDLEGEFGREHENAVFAIKGAFKFYGKRPVDVIHVPQVRPSDLVHPNEKPVGLFENLIRSLVPPGEVVADWFMGSGPCGVAAKQLERPFIGVELDPHHFETARSRIEREVMF